MADNYIQDGISLTFTSPTGGVLSGEGVVVGDTFVVSLGDYAEGDIGEGGKTGVWALPKKAAEVIAQGIDVYADANGDITATATDNTYAGQVWKAALAGDATINVRIG